MARVADTQLESSCVLVPLANNVDLWNLLEFARGPNTQLETSCVATLLATNVYLFAYFAERLFTN